MAEPSDPFVQEDEIDLAELFYSLWAQKMLIATVAFVFVVTSASYALRATPQYDASVVFEISGKQSNQSFSSDLTGLANLAGLNIGGGSEDKAVFDRLQGRDFILGVAKELSLDQDPYFNPYSGEEKSPSLLDLIKTQVKSILAPTSDEQTFAGNERLSEDAIVAKFGEVVTASQTQNGSIKIEAVHVDPVRAAALANTSMNRLLAALDTERREEQEKQLAYLSEELADALTAMNDAQEQVQEFGLKNSLVSTSAFATRSESMFRLRDEMKRGQEMSAATAELLKLAGSGNNLTEQDYIELRRNFPIVDDVDFRRFLGIPDTLDQWAWPDKTRLVEFQNIISNRVARARREVDQLQVEAERYAKASDELSFLERDARVAEAMYQVLIERTKSQAFSAGFDTDIAKIYQVAVPATHPSAPRKSLIVALGAVLGLFLGSGLAILRSMQRGRLYSANTIKEAAQAMLFLRAPLRFLRARQAKKLIERAEKPGPKGLGALAIDLNEKSPKGILCVSAGSQTQAAGPAMWIAGHLAKDNARVAIVDLSGDLMHSKGTVTGGHDGPWQVSPLTGRIDLLTLTGPLQADDLLLRNSFSGDVRDLMTRYDRVVFSAAPAHADMAHRALHRLSFYLVVLCGKGLAQKSVLAELCSIAPIDACLSES